MADTPTQESVDTSKTVMVSFMVELEQWTDLDRSDPTEQDVIDLKDAAAKDFVDALTEYAEGEISVVWDS